jgi:hypothetical protein
VVDFGQAAVRLESLDPEESPGKEKKAEMNLGSAGLTAMA